MKYNLSRKCDNW